VKKIGRDWYPDTENRLYRRMACVDHIESDIMPHIPRTRCVVQAGGAAGVWPRKFAEYFSEVYTFEPNPELQACFARNIENFREADRICLNTHALWNEPTWGDLVPYEPDNMGAWYFKPEEDGPIYADTIDSYDLHEVDLIQLDIEGAEYEALLGARDTIKRCKPMICVEAKMTQHFYGREVIDLYALLNKMGYESHHSFGRDQLWRPMS
jgi:FkbM family methyltransferase